MDEDLPILMGKEGEISPDSRGCLQRVRSTLEGKVVGGLNSFERSDEVFEDRENVTTLRQHGALDRLAVPNAVESLHR